MALMSAADAATAASDMRRAPTSPARRRVLLALAGSASWPWAACRPAPPATPPFTTARAAEGYVRLALSLARHQRSLVDTWLGAAEWDDGAREPVAVLRDRLDTLRAAMAAMPPPADAADTARRRYLSGQLRALGVAAARLSGEGLSFADEAEQALGVRPPARDGAAMDQRRQDLSALLPGAGPLAERHAAYRRRMAVPPARVAGVFAAAVAWCRETAGASLPLPAGEQITLRTADESGWAAFSRPHDHRTSDVWVSKHGGADAAQLLQLAAHEGTPGHHAQHVLAFAQLVEARGWMERALSPAFGPHRLLAEGAAEAGADLLLPLEVRERVCAERLLPAAGQPAAEAARLVRVERLAAMLDMEVAHAAADYLDTSTASADTAARLRDQALVLDPAGMVAFIEKQRSRVLAYPLGRRVVTAALDAAPASARWAYFAAIDTLLDVEAAPDTLGASRVTPGPERE